MRSKGGREKVNEGRNEGEGERGNYGATGRREERKEGDEKGKDKESVEQPRHLYESQFRSEWNFIFALGT